MLKYCKGTREKVVAFLITNFVIISLGFLGDTILVEPMIRNIKENYPNSNIIFIVEKTFHDVVAGFEGVDKIYDYDKKIEQKGILRFLNFLKSFKEKNIESVIITHPHERSLFLALSIKPKNIISLPLKGFFNPLNIFINKKIKYNEYEIRNTYKGIFNLKYIKSFCQNIKEYNVVFSQEERDITRFSLPNDYIVLSPTSKTEFKDWDYANIKDFLLHINLPVVLVGLEKAKKIAMKLHSENVNFIDLTNKTTISELAQVIKNSKYCISVDTGTFHLAYAQKVKTIGLFYNEKMIIEWAPQNLNFVKIIKGIKHENNKNIITEKEISYKEVLNTIQVF